MLDRLSRKSILILYRIAKDQKKGAYPFFRNPRVMIELRMLWEKINDKD